MHGPIRTSATPITYRWQRCLYHSNCADVGNGPSFSRVAHGSDSFYFVRCLVSNAYGVVTTRWANAWPRWVNMQAEDGAYTGAAVTTEGTDWSGRGALIFWSNTGTLTVKPQINNAGTYKLWMRYKSPAPVSVKLELNGAALKSNWALPSGTYNNFILLDVQLPVGVSTLKLTLLSGSPVFDGFDIL